MRKALLMSFVLCTKISSMNVSFENLYFKLYPQIAREYPRVYCVLISAVGYDANDKRILEQDRQGAFINYLFQKKGLSIEAHPTAWSRAIERAAKAGNAEGLRILLGLGVEKQPEKSCAISQAVSSWLSKKQIKKDAMLEKRTDQSYFDVIKMLSSHGFSPHMLQISIDVRPFKLALKHQQKLPGLIDLLVLYADPNDFVKSYSIEYSRNELKFLMHEYAQKQERVFKLAGDPNSYFSRLVPDMQRQVALYDFRYDYDNFLKEANKTMVNPPLPKRN